MQGVSSSPGEASDHRKRISCLGRNAAIVPVFRLCGDGIVFPVAHRPSLQYIGINTTKIVNVGEFTSD